MHPVRALRAGEQVLRPGEEALCVSEQALRLGEQVLRLGDRALRLGEQALCAGEQMIFRPAIMLRTVRKKRKHGIGSRQPMYEAWSPGKEIYDAQEYVFDGPWTRGYW